MKKITTPPGSVITACYLVPGLPHILLAPEKSAGWKSLNAAYAKVREEIQNSDAEMILYFSSQWLSVLGYLFQADPNPEWVQVDHNWHELGSMPYKFKVDAKFAAFYAREVKEMGHYVREVNYRGFPIDTGTIVAQKLLNPDNRLPAAMASCNMYAEKQETLSIGQAGLRALEKYGKRTVVVLVSSLSSRYEVKDIDPAHDKISSLKDDEWNRKILDLLGEGRLEDVSEVAREFARQANADMGFKGLWWLNGLVGKTNDFSGQLFDYQPVWGTGNALVGFYPKRPIVSIPDWVNDEPDLVERMGTSSTRGASPQDKGEVRVKNARVTAGATTVVAQSDADHAPTGRIHSKPATANTEGAVQVHSKRAPEPVGPYPHARREGEFIFVSGIGPRKPGTKEIPGVTVDAEGNVIDHDVEIQTRSVIENIKVILEDAGSGLHDIVDVQVFLTHMKRDFQKFNKVYGEHFSKNGPTRTTVEVGSLPTPIAVELKVIARPKH